MESSMESNSNRVVYEWNHRGVISSVTDITKKKVAPKPPQWIWGPSRSSDNDLSSKKGTAVIKVENSSSAFIVEYNHGLPDFQKSKNTNSDLSHFEEISSSHEHKLLWNPLYEDSKTLRNPLCEESKLCLETSTEENDRCTNTIQRYASNKFESHSKPELLTQNSPSKDLQLSSIKNCTKYEDTKESASSSLLKKLVREKRKKRKLVDCELECESLVGKKLSKSRVGVSSRQYAKPPKKCTKEKIEKYSSESNLSKEKDLHEPISDVENTREELTSEIRDKPKPVTPENIIIDVCPYDILQIQEELRQMEADDMDDSISSNNVHIENPGETDISDIRIRSDIWDMCEDEEIE